MPVTVYRWDDPSAPILNYAAGSMIAILNACLVTGYGTKAGAGWSKPFVGASKAVYRQGVLAGAHQHHLDVDDYAPTAVKIRGYRVMTAVNVGSYPFPTTVQKTAYYANKGTKLGVNSRWVIVADARTAYVFMRNENALDRGWYSFGFGDIASWKKNDATGCFISGHQSPSYSSLGVFNNDATYVTNGEFLARNIDDTVTSEYLRKSFTKLGNNQPLSGDINGGVTYPDVQGSAILSPFFICEGVTGSVMRGTHRGIWALCHPQPYANLDTFSGTGDLLGKQFMAINISGVSITQYYGQIAVEISDTWAASN